MKIFSRSDTQMKLFKRIFSIDYHFPYKGTLFMRRHQLRPGKDTKYVHNLSRKGKQAPEFSRVRSCGQTQN